MLPGMPGWEGGEGELPEPPTISWPEPPTHQPGVPGQPIAPIPGPGGVFVVYWSPQFGWVLVPANGPGSVGEGEQPDNALPEPEPTPPTPTPYSGKRAR
jgi:hypothetical protein